MFETPTTPVEERAADFTPQELFAQLDQEIATSQRILAEHPDLDQLAAPTQSGDSFNLRWLLVHLIEEYARHVGHADFIRQSIDGSTGD